MDETNKEEIYDDDDDDMIEEEKIWSSDMMMFRKNGELMIMIKSLTKRNQHFLWKKMHTKKTSS